MSPTANQPIDGDYIDELPEVIDPAAELPGALFEIVSPTGQGGGFVSRAVSIEQLADYLAARLGNSTPSPSKLPAPANLRQTGATSNSATMAWDAVPGATGYRLRVNGSTLYMAGPALTYTITGLAAGTSNAVQVQALADGTTATASDYSPGVQATTPAAGGQPSVTPGTAQGSDSVTFTSATAA